MIKSAVILFGVNNAKNHQKPPNKRLFCFWSFRYGKLDKNANNALRMANKGIVEQLFLKRAF